jgi:hypothetical protein
MAAPLTVMWKNLAWQCGPSQQQAVIAPKEALLSGVCLTQPYMDFEFTISCDASSDGIGAVLAQERSLGLRSIAFESRVLKLVERNYCITELECLAVVHKNFVVH